MQQWKDDSESNSEIFSVATSITGQSAQAWGCGCLHLGFKGPPGRATGIGPQTARASEPQQRAMACVEPHQVVGVKLPPPVGLEGRTLSLRGLFLRHGLMEFAPLGFGLAWDLSLLSSVKR